MSAGRGVVLPLLASVLFARTGRAQEAGPDIFAGVEHRSLTFVGLPGLRQLRQTALPVGAVVPLGRFTLDLGSSWVSTRMERNDGISHTVNGFTDTQLRGSYTLGRDAAVATVVMNLPTGLSRASTRDYTVIGAVSPSLFGFPVPSYASGFSVTGGLAGATARGNWSLGLAGSLRVSGRFTPFEDVSGPLTYKPGLEGRIRGGIDGLVGSSRLSAALTYSTFGDDQFGQGTTVRGQYSPGARWVVETALLAPIGGSTLSLSLWNFKRNSGDTTGASARNRENLAGADAMVSIPVTAGFSIEPLVTGRWSHPETGSARMLGAGTGLQLRLAPWASFAPAFRYDSGWVEDESGGRVDLSGVYFSVLVKLFP